MNTDYALFLAQECLVLAMMLALPPLAAAWVAGLLVGWVQGLLQVQDNTVTFVPKVLAAGVALVAVGPWIAQHLQRLLVFVIDGAGRVGAS